MKTALVTGANKGIGYEVARELSGEAGLAAFERLRPEVVILDLHLPGMDGLEVLERLREKGAVVILLLWFWVGTLVLLAGAEIDA